MHRQPHDTNPPPNWPESITYLTKSRLHPQFPPSLIPFIQPTSKKFAPHPIQFPSSLQIKKIDQKGHPAYGQCGLFAKKKLGANELVIPYLGIIHFTLIPLSPDAQLDSHRETEGESDYDLSLLKISASDPLNPFPGSHVSIGIGAAKMGNAGRFVNDYRGVGDAPNAEFRVGVGEAGERRMEIWTLGGKGRERGVGKGEEILVSYGKGWWGARRG